MKDSVMIAAGQTEHREVILSNAESHFVIDLKDDSSADIIVRLNASGEQVVCNIEAVVGAHARCTILFINEASPESIVMIAQRGEVGEGGVLRWQNVTLGGKTVMHDLVSRCSGHDSESAVDWMFYGKGTETQTLTVRNIFDGRNGRGEILMRGVAEGKAFAVAKGMIEIGLGGGGTNTYLTQNVLMLDSTSKVDAVPALEIKTNDVKASHSATVSRLTQEDLFYFASRSIDPQTARAMYVQGFLGDITQRISDPQMRVEVMEMIEKKYGRVVSDFSD